MVYGAEMPFHSARSIGLMPLFTASRYSVSPRLTTTLTPGLAAEPEDAPAPGARTTLLLQAASASASIASRATVVMRVCLVILRLVLAVRRSGRRRASSRKPLEQFLRDQPATADQRSEIDHGADVGQVADQHRPAVALDEADRIRHQRKRRDGVAEGHEAEGQHQQQRGEDEGEVVDDLQATAVDRGREAMRTAEALEPMHPAQSAGQRRAQARRRQATVAHARRQPQLAA